MSKPKPAVSVLIVSYNCLEQLRECLDSIRTQTDAPAHEVVVVDNNSSDQSATDIREHYPWVTLIANKDNVGFGRAQNQAAKAAQGEWLFVLNPDTILPPSTLGRLYARRGEATLIAPQLRHADGALQRSAHRNWPGTWSHVYLYNFFVFVLWQRLIPGYDPTLYSVADHARSLRPKHVMGAAMFMNATAFHDAGGFDEAFFLYLEETDLCYRLQGMGHSVAYLPEIVITHQLGSSIQAGAMGQGSPYYLESAYHYYSKRHGSRQTRFLFGMTRLLLASNLLQLRVLHTIWPKQSKIALGLDFTRRALAWHDQHRKDYQ